MTEKPPIDVRHDAEAASDADTPLPGPPDEAQEVERMRLEVETRQRFATDPDAPLDRLDEPLREELMEDVQGRQFRG